MSGIIKELETRVRRTYMGGALLNEFLGKNERNDSFYPEDWISSFVEAKNKQYVPGEGITRIEGDEYITQAVTEADFGQGRKEPGVLIKFLDSSERLGIQVHPTDSYAKKIFGTGIGKTEGWHILATRTINGEEPKVYLGFKPHITRELWEDYYRRQDIKAMLEGMYEIPVKPGDTILVCGGTPHAIGGGCLLLEIQQPSDYTMRCETIPLSGDPYTPQQIHYGAGEDAMLDCFNYEPISREELEERYVLRPVTYRQENCTTIDYITYDNTPCFALREKYGSFIVQEECFVTLVSLESRGVLECEGRSIRLNRGDKYFVPARTKVTCAESRLLICYPPKI